MVASSIGVGKRLRIRIFQDSGQFREKLITNRSQFVLALGALTYQLVAMLNGATQLCGSLDGRKHLANSLQRITDPDTFVQLAALWKARFQQ
ncbi:MAG TPA: hypothetical protein VFN35_01015 [Ktedonobacteraceae bacterium]|nr:hypothetical protein [Ktedonobacteraceae bacterium]